MAEKIELKNMTIFTWLILPDSPPVHSLDALKCHSHSAIGPSGWPKYSPPSLASFLAVPDSLLSRHKLDKLMKEFDHSRRP
jgi:hypothetical protein